MSDGRVNNGGARKGAGRKSKKHEYQDDGLLSPLQFMLQTMRDDNHPHSVRMDAAKSAAPYCSAKLLSQSIDVDADVNIQLVSYLANSTDSSD